MNSNNIIKYVFYDMIRNKWIFTYTLILLCLSFGIIYFSGDITKSIASILNIALIIVPLVCILFSSIHYYNSREFIQMLLSQPVKRSSIFWAEYSGLSFSLSLSFFIGTVLPLSLYGISGALVYLFLSGIMLTFIFVAVALHFSIKIDDKVKGMGLLLFVWLYFSVIFDGLILFIYFLFNDYPLEKLTIILTFFNPVDISRILILLNLDISALMGYSGATFAKFFGNIPGIMISVATLLVWIFVPLSFALAKFKRKNF